MGYGCPAPLKHVGCNGVNWVPELLQPPRTSAVEYVQGHTCAPGPALINTLARRPAASHTRLLPERYYLQRLMRQRQAHHAHGSPARWSLIQRAMQPCGCSVPQPASTALSACFAINASKACLLVRSHSLFEPSWATMIFAANHGVSCHDACKSLLMTRHASFAAAS